MPVIVPPLAISPEDLHTLGQWSRSGSIRAALVERAKILLLAAEGTSNTEIASQVGCSRPTVILWRRRYAQGGLDGLLDRPRPGRPQTVRRDRRAEILAATLSPPPSTWGARTGRRGCWDRSAASMTRWLDGRLRSPLQTPAARDTPSRRMAM